MTLGFPCTLSTPELNSCPWSHCVNISSLRTPSRKFPSTSAPWSPVYHQKKDPFAFNSLSKAPIPEGLSISLLSHRGQWRWQRWADSWESVIWGVLSQRIPPFTGGKTSSSQLIRTSSCNDYETITKIFGKRSLNPAGISSIIFFIFHSQNSISISIQAW